MVAVPAGQCTIGSDEEADERPRHRVWVAAFFIDRDEVTEAAYAACVAHKQCPPLTFVEEPPGQLPVTSVSFFEAVSFCRFLGKRLPTEAEWERAATGDGNRRFPWGDQPDCAQANFGNYEGEGRCPHNPGRPIAVGHFPGASPFGVRDLAGNVWEWVADRYRPDAYRRAQPQSRSGNHTLRAVRGGGCCSMFGLPRAQNRLAFVADYRDIDLGFRCAR